MTCAPKYQFGLFGSIFFAAVVLGSLVFAPLADKVGRRPVTLAGIGLVAISQSLLLFSTSLYFSYGLIFLMGLSMPMRVFVGYIYSMEFLPLNRTEMATALTLGCDGLGITIAALWFMFVSKDWKTFFLMTTILCYLSFIFVFCTMSESPKFLVSRGKYQAARSVITKMRKCNRKQYFIFSRSRGETELVELCQDGNYGCLWEDEVKKVQRRDISVNVGPVETIEDCQSLDLQLQLSESKAEDSFSKFLESCLNLANVLIFVYLFCAASFNYYLINFYLKYIPGDIFINSIVASLAETTAHWLSGFISIKFGPANGMCASFCLAGCAGAALWFCDANDM